MIELPNEYKNNIISMFGEVGQNWLERIPNIIDKYIKEFGLYNIKINENLTYNVLLFADSNKYGKVIIKIEIPFEEMTIRESLALELNNGIGACKCFYKNIPDGVLVLERLQPGYSLNVMQKLEDRIKIFANVANRFNISVNEDCGLPTYSSILNRSINMVIQDDKFSDIRELAMTAHTIYQDIENKNDNNYLLHSDLYSDNIIMSDKTFKAIDPHGFIGNKIIDTAIITQKELDKLAYTYEHIDHILSLLSIYCEFNKQEIAKALYVNYVLNICWDREVNIINNESIDNAKIILDYVNNYTDYNHICNNKELTKNKKLF